jgi:hypothetical protein
LMAIGSQIDSTAPELPILMRGCACYDKWSTVQHGGNLSTQSRASSMTDHVEFPDRPGSHSTPSFESDLDLLRRTLQDGQERSSDSRPSDPNPLSSYWHRSEAELAQRPPVRLRELAGLLAMVALADVTIFRGTGYAGVALFLIAAPFLLLFASPAPVLSAALLGVGSLIALTAARMIWQGAVWSGIAGLLLLIAFAMKLAGRTPFVLELTQFALQAWIDGVEAIGTYEKWIRQQLRQYPLLFSLQWILPLAAVFIFGGIFIAANPDLVRIVQELLSRLLTGIQGWLEAFATSPLEVLFWVQIAWFMTGILRPIDRRRRPVDAHAATQNSTGTSAVVEPIEATHFAAFRNTLAAVSVLFAVYLVFEFQTLWFRTFPVGFHYSGYAHQGAAWLTVALALATAVLSMIFRGPILTDPRVAKLRFWAWTWSALNLVLALAVYHRLGIYIEFNGMTRMRTVALLGTTSVLVGFLLVLWKIARNRSFLWLLRRHLLTVAMAAYLYVIMPVDWLVYSYNVRQILAGNLAPVVQITEHELSPEGILTLPPLLEASDPIIREGIQSLLEEQALIESASPNHRAGWTSYQRVHTLLARPLELLSPVETDFDSYQKRQTTWQRLRTYAYQWY